MGESPHGAMFRTHSVTRNSDPELSNLIGEHEQEIRIRIKNDSHSNNSLVAKRSNLSLHLPMTVIFSQSYPPNQVEHQKDWKAVR